MNASKLNFNSPQDNGVVMASEKIGEVQMASSSWIPGTRYDVYWDKNTGKVYVAREYAGTASSKEQAMIEAEYYSTTKKTRS